MVIKVISELCSNIQKTDRFEPKYHRLFGKFDKILKSKNYEIINLGDKKLLKKITDGEHAGQHFLNEGIRFIKNSSVKDFSIELNDDFFISIEKHQEQKRSQLKAFDILFTTVGHLGSTTIIPEDFGDANINQNLVKMEVDRDFINPYYLTVYLNSNITKKQIAALFTCNIHGILTYPKIKNIKIIIPNKKLEEEISNKYKETVDLNSVSYNLIKQAQKIFYDNINIDFEFIKKEKYYSINFSELKESKFWTPEFFNPLYINTRKVIQKKYETITLGEIATFKKGDEVGSVNYNEYLDKKNTDIPFVRTSDIVNYEVDLYPDYYIPKEIYSELNQDLKPNDIIFTNDGKIGSVAMLTKEDKIILQSHIKRLRLKQSAINKYNLTQEYLILILTIKQICIYQTKRYTVIQSTIPTISNNIENFEIPILGKTLIDKITELVKKAFELKTKRKQILKEVREEIENYFDI